MKAGRASEFGPLVRRKFLKVRKSQVNSERNLNFESLAIETNPKPGEVNQGVAGSENPTYCSLLAMRLTTTSSKVSRTKRDLGEVKRR
jgi:hypothetical protein